MKVNRVNELRKRNERFSSPCAVEVPNVSSVTTQLQKLGHCKVYSHRYKWSVLIKATCKMTL